METCLKETLIRPPAALVAQGKSLAVAPPVRVAAVALAFLLCRGLSPAQSTPATAGPPPSSGGVFPLSEVRRGMTATAWTVFTGSKPEPMEVEILGVLRGARGPGHDMILVQLHGAKPEYTGVVEGMSGSPVYIGNRLLGSLSYRIGQFSKDPIAGITPIEQMLEVRDLPIDGSEIRGQESWIRDQGSGIRDRGSGIRDRGSETAEALLQAPAEGMIQAMETPLVMSGFGPDAIRLWRQQMAGTSLETVAAGGMSGDSESGGALDREPSAAALAGIVPGSAVSAQLVRGDLEIAATCTVTYIDPKQLLACGHAILQAGPVSLPMTATEVVATLASPLNAFKIVNTGKTIGAFTEDRDAAIRGVLGGRARMIPVHIAVHLPGGDGRPEGTLRKVDIEVLDLPSLTPQAVMVSLYQALLASNESTAMTSYHVTGSIDLDGNRPAPLEVWASAGDQMASPLEAALQVGEQFFRLYSNGARQGAVRGIELNIEAIPRRIQVQLETARLVSSNIAHAGDTVVVEATIRPWQQAARNVRIPITLPARLGAGNLRLLISDSGTLDRTLDQPRQSSRPADLDTVLAQDRARHAADRIYVSLLVPETQAGMSGQTLASLPLSVANALEPLRTAQDVNLNGESAEVVGEASAGGVLTGFQILNLRIETGGGLK
ncbi:MAG: SpoIVB peptidase S55 [Terracidiphilus sp.]